MTSSTIFLNDVIGIGNNANPGITAEDFRQDYNRAIGEHPDVIDLIINSPGGSVFDGNVMCTIIEQSPIPFDAYIEGIACSMASLIPLYCRKVYMAANALMMIHNPSAGSQGESKDLRRDADLLDKLKATMLKKYVVKTGLPEKQVSDMMDAETWMTADEAKAYGFIDEITGVGIERSFWMKAIAQAKPGIEKTLEIFNQQKADNMDLTIDLPKALGLKRATPEQILAEVKRLKSIVDEADKDTPGSVANIVAVALNEGLIQKETELELTAMGNGNAEVLKQYLNRLRETKTEETAKRVDSLFVKQASNLVRVSLPVRAALRKLAMLALDEAELVICNLPKHESFTERISTLNQGENKQTVKSKAEWTLEDYRKNAPGELESNRALYDALCEKEFSTKL